MIELLLPKRASVTHESHISSLSMRLMVKDLDNANVETATLIYARRLVDNANVETAALVYCVKEES